MFFNVLMQLVVFKDNKFILLMFFVALLYFLISLIIVIKHKSIFFANTFQNSNNSSNVKGTEAM